MKEDGSCLVEAQEWVIRQLIVGISNQQACRAFMCARWILRVRLPAEPNAGSPWSYDIKLWHLDPSASLHLYSMPLEVVIEPACSTRVLFEQGARFAAWSTGCCITVFHCCAAGQRQCENTMILAVSCHLCEPVFPAAHHNPTGAMLHHSNGYPLAHRPNRKWLQLGSRPHPAHMLWMPVGT